MYLVTLHHWSQPTVWERVVYTVGVKFIWYVCWFAVAIVLYAHKSAVMLSLIGGEKVWPSPAMASPMSLWLQAMDCMQLNNGL